MPPRMKSKYGNNRTKVDGRSFHSKVEAQRYLELKEREKQGSIFGLVCQPRYSFQHNGVHICTYIADFRYITDQANEQMSVVVEDVKGGIITNDFTMKKNMMLAYHNIPVRIVTKRSHNKTSRWYVDGVLEEKMALKEISNEPR